MRNVGEKYRVTCRSSRARNFLTRHPLADIFRPPYPPIASQSISQDVPVARARVFQFTLPLLRGPAEAALYCAHSPNPLFPFQG